MRSSIYGIPTRLSCNFSFTQNFISSRPFVLCIISWKRGLDRSLLRFPLSASLLRDSLLRVVHSTIFIERDSIENKISYSCTHRFIDGNKSKMDNEERRFLEGIKFEFQSAGNKRKKNRRRKVERSIVRNCFRGKILVLFPTFLLDRPVRIIVVRLFITMLVTIKNNDRRGSDESLARRQNIKFGISREREREQGMNSLPICRTV